MIRHYLSFIRFSHSVFALPFALVGALLATRITPVGWRQLLWIVVASSCNPHKPIGGGDRCQAHYRRVFWVL